MKRPSHKELSRKIRAAQKAVREGQVTLLDDQEELIVSDAFELGYEVEHELIDILSDLLAQTTPEDYAGVRPPQKSYEKEIKGLELFAFGTNSNLLGCRVYLTIFSRQLPLLQMISRTWVADTSGNEFVVSQESDGRLYFR